MFKAIDTALLLKFSIWISSVSGIILKNGGYENVLVGLEDNMEIPDDCGKFLDKVESAFASSSRLLHQLTDTRVFIRNVTIVLPKTWRDCPKISDPAPGVSWTSSDFMITNAGALNIGIWTLQGRGCGEAAEYVHLPRSIFEAETLDVGRTILTEWNKLRYGVFDETGFTDDPIYPDYYKASGKVLRTGCSAEDKGLNCSSASSSEGCVAIGASTRTGFEPCSVLGSPPTKQHILCSGRSSREVIFSHTDFQNKEFTEFSTPHFKYVTEAPVKFVLALDAGSAMIDRDNWKFVRIASRRFILYDLPNGTELGLVSFSSKARSDTESLVVLSSDKARESIVARIPDYPDKTAEKCLECAVQEAIQMFEHDGGSAAGNAMILVTSGTTNVIEINAAVNLAKVKQMKISVVAYTDSFEHQDFITSETGGFLTSVPSRGVGSSSHLSMMIRLGDALLATVRYHLRDTIQEGELPFLVHEAEYQDATTSIVNGTFFLDQSLNRDNLFALYFYSRDNPYIKRLWLTRPNGTTYEGKSEYSMSGHYFTPLHGVDMPGIWSYAFERESQSHQSHFVKVLSRPQTTKHETVTARLLTIDAKEMEPTSFVLIAQVNVGLSPVHDARVRVQVRYNGTEVQEIELFDNGSGGADVTSGDGIYSRYFIPPVAGSMEYSFTLFVDYNDGRAYTRKPGITDSIVQGSICCGSSIIVYREDRDYLPAFQRIVTAASVRIQGTLLDDIPPSRVADLRVNVDEAKAAVALTWSAPGSNLDSGKAKKYELRYSTSLHELTTDFENMPLIPNIDDPLAFGSRTDFSFQFPNYDTPYFFAIRASNSGGKAGKLSNSVEAFIRAPPTTLPPLTTVTPLLKNASPKANLHLTVGAVAGIAAGGLLAFVLIVIASCCAVNRRKKREKYVKGAELNSTAVYTSGQLKNAAIIEPTKMVTVDTVDSSARPVLQPVHWSASQLLSEHEKRRTPVNIAPSYPSYQPNPTSDYSYLNDSYQQTGSVYSTYNITPSIPYYPVQDQGFRQEERYGGGSPRSGSYSGASEGLPPPYESSGEYPIPLRVPPPTLPKPKGAKNRSPNLQGSFTSLASDRKRRNITQV